MPHCGMEPPQEIGEARRDLLASGILGIFRGGRARLRDLALTHPLEAAQHRGRIGGVRADPALMDPMNGQRVEMIPALAAAPLDDHQPRLFENLQMLHHRTSVELRHQFAEHPGRARFRLERVQNPAPGSMAQSLEQRIVLLVR